MKLINFENILAVKGLQYAEAKVKKAYEKSCEGNWDSLKDIKFLDNLDTYYIHIAIFEALARNLIAYKEGD